MTIKTLFLCISLATITVVACKPKISAQESGFRSVDVQTAKQLIAETKDIIILDVRTPGETAEGVIPGAVKIDVQNTNFLTEVNKLDKNKTCLVYCRSGGRSMTASKIMLENGFTDVVNMEGGYSAWPK